MQIPSARAAGMFVLGVYLSQIVLNAIRRYSPVGLPGLD